MTMSKRTNDSNIKSTDRNFTKPRLEGPIRKRSETPIRLRKPETPETIKFIRLRAPQRPVAKPTIPASKTFDSVAPQIASTIPEPADANSTLGFHPLADIFPIADEAHLQALAKDISACGLLDEIVLHDGKILDGRCRYLACERASVTPRFRQYDGNDPLGFVISRNVHRRHLSKNQRVLAAARAATLPVGSNQSTPGGLPIGRAAKIFEVSERNIARAKAILLQGTTQLVEAVETGKVALSRAADLCKLAQEVQTTKLREIIERKRTPRKQTKKPAAAGNESIEGNQSGRPSTSQLTAGAESEFVIPKTVHRRVSRDLEAAYAELLAVWNKTPRSVCYRFKEEVLGDF